MWTVWGSPKAIQHLTRRCGLSYSHTSARCVWNKTIALDVSKLMSSMVYSKFKNESLLISAPFITDITAIIRPYLSSTETPGAIWLLLNCGREDEEQERLCKLCDWVGFMGNLCEKKWWLQFYANSCCHNTDRFTWVSMSRSRKDDSRYQSPSGPGLQSSPSRDPNSSSGAFHSHVVSGHNYMRSKG